MKSKLFKRILIFVSLIISIFTVSSCGVINSTQLNKYKITTTLYPQYEFVKAILGDNKQLNSIFEVSIIVPPGADSHTFDPRLVDLIEIKNTDLFIYTSEELETWVTKLELSNIDVSLDLSSDERIKLLEVEEACDEDHDHSTHANHTHAHTFDPHFWVYPIYATYMVDSIRNKMIELLVEHPKSGSDKPNEKVLEAININANKYIDELLKIDEALKIVSENATNRTMIFASPFSFYYWSYYYDLEYVLTYATCSTEVDPSINTIINVINKIRENDVKTIYVKELLNTNVAEMISSHTGAEIVLLHSCHNISNIDYQNNVSFYDLMKENVYHLAKGLGVDPSIITVFNESEVEEDAVN